MAKNKNAHVPKRQNKGKAKAIHPPQTQARKKRKRKNKNKDHNGRYSRAGGVLHASSGKGKYQIVHVPYREECLGPLTSSGTANAFSVQSFVLNIGNSTSFPLGSIQAPLYQRHRFKRLRYRIETTSGMAIGSTSTALGSTLLNCDYNVVDSVFANQIAMEDYGKNGVKKACKEAVIYKNNFFEVDCSKWNNLEPDQWLFVQPGTTGTTVTPIANTSVHEYAHGLMQIASYGLQGTSQVIGRIFVGYESEFCLNATPQGGISAVSAHLSEKAAGTGAAATPFGTSGGVLRAGSTLTSVSTNTTFTIPKAGTYAVTTIAIGSATVVATLTPGANITTTTNVVDDDGFSAASAVAAGTAINFAWFVVTADGTGAANTVTVTGLTNFAAGSFDVFISQMNPNILTALPPKSEVELEQEARILKLERLVQLMVDTSDFGNAHGHEDADQKTNTTPSVTSSTAPSSRGKGVFGLLR